MKDDKIGQILDLAPLDNEDSNLPTKYVPTEEHPDNKQIEIDAKYVRDNIRNLLEDGYQAVQEMMNIADQSQHPRSYEVLSNMIRQMVETNKDLLDIHEKKKKLIGKSEEAKSTTNNNLFVGSTSELLKMIKDTNESD